MAQSLTTLESLLTGPVAQELVARPAQTMAGGGSPLDGDLTIFIYLGLFLVVWMVLKPLIFDPYLKVRDARETGIGGSREEADKLRQDADARKASYEEGLEAARNDAAQKRDALKAEGSAKEAEILAAARNEASQKLDAHRAQLEEQVAKARKELEGQAETLADAIVDRLLPSA